MSFFSTPMLPHQPGLRRLVAWFALAAAAAHAQEPAPYTLHVYTHTIQIPALVLSQDLDPLPPIAADRFSISLGNRKPFRPSSVRREGNDPITLAVLLDTGGSQDEILPAFARAFSSLAPFILHPADHVLLYAVDCTLVNALNDVSADPDILKAALEAAQAAPGLHGKKNHAACGSSLPLWDSMTVIMNTLKTLPGRRVLLVVSGGQDGRSHVRRDELHDFAAHTGTAIFSLRDPTFDAYADVTASFRLLCENSGGLALTTSPQRLRGSLQHFVDLLRGRYILDFARQPNTAAGTLTMTIHVDGMRPFIRAAGASVPIADPIALPSETEMQSDPPAPKLP